eukprot:TRINITY_DN2717_c0_g1_i2.p1 TRINITY_DN2717_c0_g1~~TRINITY_DN2717_c0_g1_i2.p1  ORF type:complete len:196 (+),score=30.87 TRINITY_DN2717_c0_g1_i2:469-1056(+)
MNGVNSFDGGSSSFASTSTTLNPIGFRVADWTNGAFLVTASKTAGKDGNKRRVDLGFFPPSGSVVDYANFWNSSTDGALLMANSLIWVATSCASLITTSTPSTLTPSTTEPSTLTPSTLIPSTQTPSTLTPSTTEPSTLAPSTTEPSTWPPSTLIPSTQTPSTLTPSTTEPSTLTPSTLIPSTTVFVQSSELREM